MKISEILEVLKDARKSLARADEIDGLYTHKDQHDEVSNLINSLEAGEVIEDDRR